MTCAGFEQAFFVVSFRSRRSRTGSLRQISWMSMRSRESGSRLIRPWPGSRLSKARATSLSIHLKFESPNGDGGERVHSGPVFFSDGELAGLISVEPVGRTGGLQSRPNGSERPAGTRRLRRQKGPPDHFFKLSDTRKSLILRALCISSKIGRAHV